MMQVRANFSMEGEYDTVPYPSFLIVPFPIHCVTHNVNFKVRILFNVK